MTPEADTQADAASATNADAASGTIDRITPTRRPGGKAKGYQLWRDLLFLHWEVPVSTLRPLVPASLDIDTYGGRAYIGVVPFAMFGVRPALVPRFAGVDFLETNVRTYVHVGGRDPGVYFFSLDAASWLAVKAARAGWGLPYFYAAMSMYRHDDQIHYTLSRREDPRCTLDVRYHIGKPLGASQPGTLEHFLMERYLLHVERRGVLLTGQVSHQPYPVHEAAVDTCSQDLTAAAGVQELLGAPELVHYAPGVDVEVFALRPSASHS